MTAPAERHEGRAVRQEWQQHGAAAIGGASQNVTGDDVASEIDPSGRHSGDYPQEQRVQRGHTSR